MRRPHPPPAGGTFPKGEGKEGVRAPALWGKCEEVVVPEPSPLGKVAERSEVG